MAARPINEWDTNPNDNSFPGADGGFPELMPRSDVNDAMRVHLSEMRKFYNDSEWIKVRIVGPEAADVGAFVRVSGTQFTLNLSGNDYTPFFGAGRILKIVDGGGAGVDLVTQVVSSSYSNPLTTVNITSTDSINVAASDVEVHSSSILRKLSTLETENPFFIPATNDAAGINAAIVEASAAGGGLIFLSASSYSIDVPIDITGTNGTIIIAGTSPETVLVQTADNLGKMVNIDQSSELITFQNIRFNGQRTTYTTGNGYGVEIAGSISIAFENCQFLNLERGIHFTGSSGQRVQVRDCKFFSIQTYGVSTNAPTNSHRGVISGCVFDGSSVDAASAAMIRVSGNWVITGNTFENIGDGIVTPRAIWLWNETAQNGGRKSIVANNNIEGTSSLGTMIEIGGDMCAVSGNRIVPPSSGIGIFVNGIQAGQTIQGVSVTGNTIEGGAPISVNQRAQYVSITGNALTAAASNSGVECDGDNCMIGHNSIASGDIGVEITANAQGCSVVGNLISGQSASGISLVGACDAIVLNGNHILGTQTAGIVTNAAATGVTLIGNIVDGATAQHTDLSVDRVCHANSFFDQAFFKSAEPAFEVAAGTTEFDVPGFTGLDLPEGGGIGFYHFVLKVKQEGLSPDYTYRLYVGADGDLNDTLKVTYVATNAATDEEFFFFNGVFEISDGAHKKFGISAQRAGGTSLLDIDFYVQILRN